MSLAFAPQAVLNQIPQQAARRKPNEAPSRHARKPQNPADQDFDHISRKLTAGPLTLEYLVAYSIETYSARMQFAQQP